MAFLLMVAVGLIGANSLILSPIAAEVATGIAVSNPADVMMAAGTYGGGVALSALLLAPFADRFGADRALKFALLVIAAALAISAVATNLPILIVGQSLAGLGVGIALPSIYTMAALIAEPGKEAQTVGKVLTGWMLAMVGGVTLSAYGADLFGWRAVFYALGAAVLAVWAVLSAVRLPSAPRTKQITTPISAMRVPGISGALLSVAVFSFSFYGIYNYLGTHITETMNFPISDAGKFTLLYGVGFGAGMFLDRYLDHFGTRRALAAVYGALCLFLITLYQALDSYTWLLAMMFVWGMINHLALTLTVNRLTQLDPTRRGAIMGMNSAVMYIGVFGSTVSFRPLFDGWGLGACVIAAAGFALLGVLEALHARRAATRTVHQTV